MLYNGDDDWAEYCGNNLGYIYWSLILHTIILYMLLLLSVCQVKTGHCMHHQTLIDDHCLVGELGVNLNYGGRLTSNTNLRKNATITRRPGIANKKRHCIHENGRLPMSCRNWFWIVDASNKQLTSEEVQINDALGNYLKENGREWKTNSPSNLWLILVVKNC